MSRTQRKNIVELPDSQLARAEELFPGAFDRDITQALFAIRALARRLNDLADAWLSPYGINAVKQNYLAVLCFSTNGLTLNELSELIHTSNASVSVMVGQLERDGLIKRFRHPTDGRSSIIRLTAKGMRLFRNVYPVHHRNMERAMKAISPTQVRVLARLLFRLGHSFDESCAGQGDGLTNEDWAEQKPRRVRPGISSTADRRETA